VYRGEEIYCQCFNILSIYVAVLQILGLYFILSITILPSFLSSFSAYKPLFQTLKVGLILVYAIRISKYSSSYKVCIKFDKS